MQTHKGCKWEVKGKCKQTLAKKVNKALWCQSDWKQTCKGTSNNQPLWFVAKQQQIHSIFVQLLSIYLDWVFSLPGCLGLTQRNTLTEKNPIGLNSIFHKRKQNQFVLLPPTFYCDMQKQRRYMNDRSIFTSFTGTQNDSTQSGELRLLLAVEGHLETLPPTLLRGGWKQVTLYLKRIKLWVIRVAGVFLVKQGAALPILSRAQDIQSQQVCGLSYCVRKTWRKFCQKQHLIRHTQLYA